LFMSKKGVDIEKAEATFEQVYKLQALETKDRMLLAPKCKIMGKWKRHRGSLESALPMQRLTASALKRRREERRKAGEYERVGVDQVRRRGRRRRKSIDLVISEETAKSINVDMTLQELYLYLKNRLDHSVSAKWYVKNFPDDKPDIIKIQMQDLERKNLRHSFLNDDGEIDVVRLGTCSKRIQKLGFVRLGNLVWMTRRRILSQPPRKKNLLQRKANSGRPAARQGRRARSSPVTERTSAPSPRHQLRMAQQKQQQQERRRRQRERLERVQQRQKSLEEQHKKRIPRSEQREQQRNLTKKTRGMTKKRSAEGSLLLLKEKRKRNRKWKRDRPPRGRRNSSEELEDDPREQPPFREVKIVPGMRVAGSQFVFLGIFSQFSKSKAHMWIERRGGRVLDQVSRNVSVAICGDSVPQNILSRLNRLNIEIWDEEDILNFIAMHYLKSDFLPATYRITDIDLIDSEVGHEFKDGDEVVLVGKRFKRGRSQAQVIAPVNCYLPEESLERIFELWRCDENFELYSNLRLTKDARLMKPQTIITNMQHNGKIHMWYPKQGWTLLKKDSMRMVAKCSATEFIAGKLQDRKGEQKRTPKATL